MVDSAGYTIAIGVHCEVIDLGSNGTNFVEITTSQVGAFEAQKVITQREANSVCKTTTGKDIEAFDWTIVIMVQSVIVSEECQNTSLLW